MASIKVILRVPSAGGEGTLYFRVIHKRTVRQIHAGSRIGVDEWDAAGECVVLVSGSPRHEFLSKVQSSLFAGKKRLERVVASLELAGGEYTADEVVRLYHAPDAVTGFLSFARKVAEECGEMGRMSAMAHFSAAINSFMRFYGDEEVDWEDVTPALMARYEQYLKDSGVCLNTVSFYMRKLRSVYNQAAERGLTRQRNPFKHVYTGIAKTSKRAVPIDVIRRLVKMDLTLDPLSELARDVFLFSFYTRGMSMVDISYLKKSNLKNGILTYRRRKTQQELSMRWEDKMEEIVRRHQEEGSEYLLPMIREGCGDLRRQYLNASHLINRRLKKLGEKLGLTYPLTMYRARHSWASIAMTQSVPVSVISQGMGHDSERTTRIYLASLDDSVVDDANHSLIGLIQ